MKKGLVNNGDFEEALNYLHSIGGDVSFMNLTRVFIKTDAYRLYVFILYIIEREPSVDAHLAAAMCLLFGGMNFDADYLLAKRHLLDALAINPNSIEALTFILENFADCPDNTFSDEEIALFRHRYDMVK